ncbi:hypothetical protein [Salinarchaeum sp. IM2453]|nr:hypothetical protein [Salinarchaeum sp. IM2453]
MEYVNSAPWRTLGATLVSYAIILIAMTVVFFGIPYAIFLLF